MAEYLSLSKEALIEKCQEKGIPYEGKSPAELTVLLIQSCADKVFVPTGEGVTLGMPLPRESNMPWEVQLQREQIALEREKMLMERAKMEMEAREAKEKRDLERVRMEHENQLELEKVRLDLVKARLEAELKTQQQQTSEMASLEPYMVTPKDFVPGENPPTSLTTSEKAARNWGVQEEFLRSIKPSGRMTTAGTDTEESIKSDLAEMKVSLEQKSLQAVSADAQKELKLLQNTTLDIAFTGVSGAGKSSLVNAFRNTPDYEKGAAKTGVKQTTMDPERYPHPTFPELTLWDLPGIGTREFKPKEYLEKVKFSRYDFFIIVASERFTENDTMLASEIRKMNKQFYFVRTKVDQAVDAERRKPNFSETQTLEEIREYCLSNLREQGAVNPKVFLISSWYLNMYDFPLLQTTLANDLTDIKRPLLIMAMPAFSREHLQEKKAAMEAVIWKKALLSCGIGAIPLPGLSLIFDLGLLVKTMQEFCMAFGLDEDSLRNLAGRVGKPIDVLRSAVKKTPMANQINPEFVRSLMTTSVLVGSAMVLEELSDFIPVIGSLIGGANSFATSFYLLKHFLENAVEDAENVLAKVLE